MNPVFALYFPDTLPPTATVNGLAALPFSIHCLRCWPGDQPPAPWSELVAAGRLAMVTSFDPGEDGRRLQNLLRELEGRRGEDALLFAQGLAAEFSARREETAPELIGPLLGQTRDHHADRQREELWQALLLLKLAENLERGELEIETELQAFEARRAALFRRLNGNEEEAAASQSPAQIEEPSGPVRPWRQARRLLRAWSRLFLRSGVYPELLLSADADAWSLLTEHAEKMGCPPQPLATLQLPRLTTGPEAATATAKQWPGLEAGQGLISALQQAANEGGGEQAAAAAAEWNRQVAEHEQNHPPGSQALELQLLPGVPLPRLISDFSREAEAPEAKTTGPAHGLLALYRAR